MRISTVVSSRATASRTMERSACEDSEFTMPLTVKATSEAVSGSPSENFTSSRMRNVHTRPSSEHS